MAPLATERHLSTAVPAVAGTAVSGSPGPVPRPGDPRPRRPTPPSVGPIRALTIAPPPAPVARTLASPAPTTGRSAPPSAEAGRAATPDGTFGRDADRLVRLLGAGRKRPTRWSAPAFAREVDLVRAHLRPIRSPEFLLASIGLEAFHPPAAARGAPALGASAVRVAYAVRWLELTDGVARPRWGSLLEG